MKKLILSTLLHYANRDIPHLAKEPFYAIKKKILEKHGVNVGTDYQHIKNNCYSCDGTGLFNSAFKGTEPCWKCWGSGVFKEEVNYLSKYSFGKYEFHIPYHRMQIFKKSDLPNVKFIEGYIRHTVPKYRVGHECALWLLLFYNFKAFKQVLTSSRTYYVKTPLVALQAIIFFFRHQLPIKIKNFLRKLKTKPKQDIHFISEDELPF